MSKKREPSPQQRVVADWVVNGSGSAIVEAVAGSGKTATLLGIIPKAQGEIGFCAYNTSISQEIKEKVSRLPDRDRVDAGTVHSFGNKILRQHYPEVDFQGSSKLRRIADEKISNKYLRSFAINAVSMAKQIGIGIFYPIEDTAEWIKMIEHFSLDAQIPKFSDILECIKQAKILLVESNSQITTAIDYDDMVYGPALLGIKGKQYDWVFLDEAQDTNPVRREIIKSMLAPGGRLIAVGDRHQAIYAWTGADHNSLDLIAEEFNTTSLPLSVTFRCPKLIVKEARRWVNHIEAHETAPEGKVDRIYIDDLYDKGRLGPEDVILCRVTRPLVELAFGLIRAGVPCMVEGRAIGDGLIRIIKKWNAKEVRQLEVMVAEWREKELRKARDKDLPKKCEEIEDQAETISVLIQQCKPNDPVHVLEGKIKELFGDNKSGEGQRILTLSTIHRAKGKEWNHVYALGMDAYSPSKWAKEPWELVQENNLCYVQVTRAKEHLTLVDVPTFRKNWFQRRESRVSW